MSTPFIIFVFIAMFAVLGALVFGLRNMMTGGSANRSNQLMQLRVFLQFIAVVLIVIGILVFRPNGG